MEEEPAVLLVVVARVVVERVLCLLHQHPFRASGRRVDPQPFLVEEPHPAVGTENGGRVMVTTPVRLPVRMLRWSGSCFAAARPLLAATPAFRAGFLPLPLPMRWCGWRLIPTRWWWGLMIGIRVLVRHGSVFLLASGRGGRSGCRGLLLHLRLDVDHLGAGGGSSLGGASGRGGRG